MMDYAWRFPKKLYRIIGKSNQIWTSQTPLYKQKHKYSRKYVYESKLHP